MLTFIIGKHNLDVFFILYLNVNKKKSYTTYIFSGRILMRMFLIQDMNSHPVFAIDNAKHSQVMLMDIEYTCML